jgi:signal transduction histidine kinase
MGRLRAMMSTTAARLSALYLLLFSVCALALVFYMTAQAARFLTSQTKAAITQEVEVLSQVYQRAGIAGLVRAIDRRSRVPGANLYLITDQSGVVLAGNVAQIDPLIMRNEGWSRQPFEYLRFAGDGVEPAHQALAQVFVLPNQMRILVGRDLGEPERFRQIVQRSLTLALAMMGLGALLIWFFVGRHALRRIDGVSLASQRIMAGDLTGRLPVTGSGDEFDRLSGNLNQMLGKIAELNEGLKQVSDNIAHDLKTPLTRLRNRAEAALSTRQTTAEYKSALEDMIAQSDQLIRTFNAILMISRLEAGYSSERVEEIDLNALARDVAELYEPLAEDAGATLTFSGGELLKVQGNRELLSQTLSNIVDNAIKYSASAAKPEIKVETGSIANMPYVRVCDNGPGIAEEDLERVTERFVRLEKSRNAPGSGLGLSLAKAVMKQHKGELRLGSDGQGLVVDLMFPQAGPQP